MEPLSLLVPLLTVSWHHCHIVALLTVRWRSTRLLGLWILSLCKDCKDLSERMGGAGLVELGTGQGDGVCIVRGYY